MNKIIGIRREDKNQWERRVPLIPDDVSELYRKHGIKTILQPSELRIFPDDEYRKAGAEINEDLGAANTIFAVKEIPADFFEQQKTYIFFSHTIKGQAYNMPMLKRMMDLKCNLIDYERIVNEKNQRLIFFGKYAGLAGLIETLHAYARKLNLKGFKTPLDRIKQAYRYASVENAKNEFRKIASEIRTVGFPGEPVPIVVGFAGYGNVSRGAQEIFDLLPHHEISPADLLRGKIPNDPYHLIKVVFKEEDMVKSKAGTFVLQDYYDHPEKYESQFACYLPHLTVLLNCIYWTEDYPRLVTKNSLLPGITPKVKLEVIGDISCDINGSIEITSRTTYPDKPTYTYFAGKNYYRDGTHKEGVTIMAIDNLPCEFSRESSSEFSRVLKHFVSDIVNTDYNVDSELPELPYPIKKALILHRGKLTPEYQYLENFLSLRNS